MSAVDRVISTARAEVGYLEKRTNAHLDSKTANAGYNNFTKYAADLDRLGDVYNGPKNGYHWCDVFVDWCFVRAFGKALALQVLHQPKRSAGAGCPYSAGYYRSAGAWSSVPHVGDQIFFGAPGDEYHTGLVVAVKGGRVYTIEGNTSGGSGVVANGGGVFCKSYPIGSSLIAGYGRPNYKLYQEDDEMLSYEQFVEYLQRYEKEQAAKAASPWAVPAVAYCKEHDIMGGDKNGGFRPQDTITRQEVAQVAMNLHKKLKGE